MSDLNILQSSFVALIDGMWWGLRDNVGPLSMYEGYAGGFRQIGIEAAKRNGGKGAESAARIATEILNLIGLDVEQNEKEIVVKKCPLWNRILERGLEYSFHIEEICWKPLLEGIGELTGAKVELQSSLRMNHLDTVKIEYKKGKAKAALDRGAITKDAFDKQINALTDSSAKIPQVGRYRFK
ncbi:MAG: hypothetical protein ACTSUB_05665 [Candidatus Thorarchaeota archaeon]